jgi:magnesium-transporting ATPase (P-type)
MNKKRLLLGLILMFLGILGIGSMLTMDLPVPVELMEVLEANFTHLQIKLLILINPLILLFVAIVIGTLLYQKVHLKVPFLEMIVGIHRDPFNKSDIFKFGITGGLIAGVLITILSLVFKSITPAEFEELGQSMQPTLAARFLYGGFTEEILLRFGLMTLLVWIVSRIIKKISNTAYWTGILLSAVLFAVAHFPVVFQSVENPSAIFIFYILLGNSVGGIVFGWLYWKKGLESAFIAHIFAHVVMVMSTIIFKVVI